MKWVGTGLCMLAAAGCHSGGLFDLSAPDLVDDGGIGLPMQVESLRKEQDAAVDAPPASGQSEGGPAEPLLAPRLLGAGCMAANECASQQCSNGRCCNRECRECEACSPEGRCLPLEACSFASCDAGVCRPGRALLGATCQSGEQCQSSYCRDGVCCESACDGPCRQCSSQGFCSLFPSVDPDCAVVSCPPTSECSRYSPPVAQGCAGYGRCADATACSLTHTPAGSMCGQPGLRCDGHGTCVAASSPLPPGPTQLCPAQTGSGPREVRAELDGVLAGCWAGESFELGTTYVHGTVGVQSDGTITLGVNCFGDARSAKVQGYDAAGVLLPGCVLVDSRCDNSFNYANFRGEVCLSLAYGLLTAHSSENGDL